MTEIATEEGEEFFETFSVALHSFLQEGMEVAREECGLSEQAAFSIMASKMLMLVVTGIINGGASKDSFLKMSNELFDKLTLELAEYEGTMQ